jgi:hypothetical protein
MSKKIIISEEQFNRIVKKSAINEIGDTEKGQEMLGKLHAKKVLASKNNDLTDANKVYNYARKQRDAEEDKMQSPFFNDDKELGKYKAYANGYIGYLAKHPNDVVAHRRVNEYAKVSEDRVKKIIKESIKHALNESEDDYDPWMNGDASWINGHYSICDGYFDVDINTSLSYVAIEGQEGEDYYLQGYEADELIKQIAKYWSEHDCTQDKAVEFIIQHTF